MSLFLVPPRKRKSSRSERQKARREEARAQRSRALQKQAEFWARRYPQLYAKVRSPDWRLWYESVLGKPWNPDDEHHYLEVEDKIYWAERVERERLSDGLKRDALAMYLLPQAKGAERRRVIMMLATPRWADREQIKTVYAERARVSAETGILHHVDHVVPLQGEKVCGLHVHWNLRVIQAFDNLSKNNRFEDT